MCPDIKVTVVDVSKERINQWNSEKLPIYEVSAVPSGFVTIFRIVSHVNSKMMIKQLLNIHLLSSNAFPISNTCTIIFGIVRQIRPEF